jgi:RNA 2',3'-cyclic 3'-phosphodiesterase
MNRLFVALNLPDEIKHEIVNLRRRVNDNPEYNWQNENKLHLTIKFIGSVPDEMVNKIAVSLNFISEYKAVSCSLKEFNFFTRKKIPKILFISMEMDESVNELVSRINSELVKFSILPESRAFTPHLTLLRIREIKEKDFIKNFMDFKVPQVKFAIKDASLFKSRLLPGGSVYSEIKKYKLKDLEDK